MNPWKSLNYDPFSAKALGLLRDSIEVNLLLTSNQRIDRVIAIEGLNLFEYLNDLQWPNGFSYMDKARFLEYRLLAELTHFRLGRYIAQFPEGLPSTVGLEKFRLRDISWPQPVVEVRWHGGTALVGDMSQLFSSENLGSLRIRGLDVKSNDIAIFQSLLYRDYRNFKYQCFDRNCDLGTLDEGTAMLFAGLLATIKRAIPASPPRGERTTPKDRFYEVIERWVRGYEQWRRFRYRRIPYTDGPKLVRVPPYIRKGRKGRPNEQFINRQGL